MSWALEKRGDNWYSHGTRHVSHAAALSAANQSRTPAPVPVRPPTPTPTPTPTRTPAPTPARTQTASATVPVQRVSTSTSSTAAGNQVTPTVNRATPATPNIQTQPLQQQTQAPVWVDTVGGGGMSGWLVNGIVHSNRESALRQAAQSQHVPNLNPNFGLKMESRQIGNNRYTVPVGTRQDWRPGEGFAPGPPQTQSQPSAKVVFTDPRSGQQTAMPEPQMRHILQMHAGQGQDISGLFQDVSNNSASVQQVLENFNRTHAAPQGIFRPGQHAGQTEFGPTDGFINPNPHNPSFQRAFQEEIDAGVRTPDGYRAPGLTPQNTLSGAPVKSTVVRTPLAGSPEPTPQGVTLPEASGGFSGTTVNVIDPDGTISQGFIGMDNRTYMVDGSRPTAGSQVMFNDGRMYGVVPSGAQPDGRNITGLGGVGGVRFTPAEVIQTTQGIVTNDMDKLITDFVINTGLPPAMSYQDLFDWLNQQQQQHDFSNIGVDNSFLQGIGGIVSSGFGAYSVGTASSASEDDESVTAGGAASGPIRETVGGVNSLQNINFYR